MAAATIESVLQEDRVFAPAPEFVKQANVSGMAAYRALCDEAERDFEGFWGRLAREHVLWSKPFTKILDESNAPFFKWFYDGELNASYNCLDRHLKIQPDKVAIIFEADDGKVTKITYRQLYHEVCKLANALKAHGIQKGDRVLVYMPMSIEVVVAMQACARIGATHSVDMGGWEKVRNVIVYKRTGTAVNMQSPRDKWWHEVIEGQPQDCEPTWVNAEHPLFILYTSGSTGKPKGVQHSTGGDPLQAVLTMKWVFDYK